MARDGVGGGKLAGILAQSNEDAVVIGIGLNVATPVAELPVDTATSLALCGATDIDRNQLLIAILSRLDARVAQWVDVGGDAEACGLAAAYRELCATLGQDVAVYDRWLGPAGHRDCRRRVRAAGPRGRRGSPQPSARATSSTSGPAESEREPHRKHGQRARQPLAFGQSLVEVDVPYPDKVLANDEQVVEHLHPHWITLVPATLWFLVICAAAGLGIGYAPSSGTTHEAFIIAIIVVAVILLIWLSFTPWLAWRTTHYVFTTHRVLIRRGVLRRTGRDIALQRINDVGFSQSLMGPHRSRRHADDRVGR